ncbi:hypothetical protein TNCT_174291 [Trichonephila clavata]|uniref:Uncharacterized protein n=1 Tax=Trichonephila clavata TaxID=2740835 RepID=A0A8X6GM56_TRICU|nr:hypothetical protein TNCT_174291 [Trichonephila clavata]
MWRTRMCIVLLMIISFILITEQANYDSSRSHAIHKRSCNVRGEECLKDIECCSTECVCSTNVCKCGTRPKVKTPKSKPQSLAQRLICRYR